MFGKTRNGSRQANRSATRPQPRRRGASPPAAALPRRSSRLSSRAPSRPRRLFRSAPQASAAAPRATRRSQAARPHAAQRRLLRHQEPGLLGADRHDRPVAARQARRRDARARKSATSSTTSSRSRISRCRSPSRRNCSRTSATTCSATVRSSRCSPATTSPTSWSTAPDRPSSKSTARSQETEVRFRDNQQLLNICQRIVSQVGRRVDESSPICDARLPDGSPRQRHRAAARHRRHRAHHPQVQEGQADPRPARPVRRDLAGRRDDPADHRPGPLQRRHLRRHRLGQDDAAQLPDPLHRRRRAHHHLRGFGRTAAAAAACRASRNPPAQHRGRGRDHHARSRQELPAHAPRAHHRRRGARTGGVRSPAGDEHRP